jgi:hypothetical protein
MANNPNSNSAEALRRIIEQIQYLVDHPRIQQKTWVANGKTWLPILQILLGELTNKQNIWESGLTQRQSPQASPSALIGVSGAYGQAFLNVSFNDVHQITPYRGGEPGYGFTRGGHSSITLRDGIKHLTSAEEALRLVNVIRAFDVSQGKDAKSALIGYTGDYGESFLNVVFSEVQHVEVYRGGEPGYALRRGGHSSITLKDGRRHLTSPNQAQLLVDAMRKE